MELTRQMVLKELATLSILHGASKSPEELAVLADIWAEDLGHLSGGDFINAVKVARKRSRFFPVPADILEAHKELMAHRPERPALPNHGAPINLDEMRAIRERNFPKMLSGIGRRI